MVDIQFSLTQGREEREQAYYLLALCSFALKSLVWREHTPLPFTAHWQCQSHASTELHKRNAGELLDIWCSVNVFDIEFILFVETNFSFPPTCTMGRCTTQVNSVNVFHSLTTVQSWACAPRRYNHSESLTFTFSGNSGTKPLSLSYKCM